MGWWLLRLSAKTSEFFGYRLIFSVTVNKTLKINSFCFKELNINKPVFVLTLKQNKGLRIISGWNKLFFWKILTFNRSYFIQYSTSNIILRIEMSTVNIKIIFVKKQKQTRERSTQGRGANSFITEMALFTPETDHSCETGYPFDNSRQICNTS